jgi:chromosome partitioning protein
MLWTFCGQKGGTGKTTLATNLASQLAKRRALKRVVLVDADRQRSASEWHQARPEGLPHVILEREDGTPEGMQRAARLPADMILIDTGGRVTPGIERAIELADFIIVPVLPSVPDIRATEAFYADVLAGVARRRELRGAVVLNGVQVGTLAQEARDYLSEETELPVLGPQVRQYVSFRRAFALGTGVIEYQPRGRAAADMHALLRGLLKESPLPYMYPT